MIAIALLPLMLAGSAPSVAAADLPALHQKTLLQLPKQVADAFTRKFPSARLVAECSGHLTDAKTTDHALTALSEADENGKKVFRILRVVATERGEIFALDWLKSPSFSVTDKADKTDEGLFFGDLRCLRPADVPAFEKKFLPGFEKPAKQKVDSRKADSVCFGFDPTYNNWQCFAFSPETRSFVRWGYQATAD